MIGSYYGNILLSSNDTVIKKIPLDITVVQKMYIPPGCFAAFAGIFLSFVLYLRKFSAEKRKEAYNLFLKANSAMENAFRQTRVNVDYDEGNKLLMEG